MTSQLLEKQDELPIGTGEDDVTRYLNEIRRYPRLSPQEERELAQRCAQGDEEAIRQMVNSNLRLVVSVAREYAGRGVPLLDLIQEGSIGLLTAAKKYDYTLDFRFSTYATKWIRKGVTRCLMNHSQMIRVPQHTLDRIRRVSAAKAKLLLQNGIEPTAAEIAQECELTEERVIQLLRLNPEVCSLDTPLGDGDDNTLGILVEDLEAPQPYEELVRDELNRAMGSLMATLNDRQRRILRLHFGMEDGTCHSLEEIGGILGITKERVRQIEKQAINKLQKLGTGMGLEDFLE